MDITIYGEVICHRNGLASFQIWLESEQLFAVKLEPSSLAYHLLYDFQVQTPFISMFAEYFQLKMYYCLFYGMFSVFTNGFFIFEPISSLNMNIFFLN